MKTFRFRVYACDAYVVTRCYAKCLIDLTGVYCNIALMSQYCINVLFFKIFKYVNVHFATAQCPLKPGTYTCSTGMRIIKLNLFPVPLRLHSGSGILKFRRYFTMFCDI